MIPAPIMKDVGEAISYTFPGLGFALLVFELNDANGHADYISNAHRGDMIKFLRETADRLESKQDFQAPSN